MMCPEDTTKTKSYVLLEVGGQTAVPTNELCKMQSSPHSLGHWGVLPGTQPFVNASPQAGKPS